MVDTVTIPQIISHYRQVMLGAPAVPMPHLVGAPGMGKSSLITQAATILGVKTHVINVARLNPLEIEGVEAVVNRKLQFHLSHLWADLQDGDIVFLEEFMNGFPEVYNALLDIITSNSVRGHQLPRVVWFAASNSLNNATGAVGDRLVTWPHYQEAVEVSQASLHGATIPRLVAEANLHPMTSFTLEQAYSSGYRPKISDEYGDILEAVEPLEEVEIVPKNRTSPITYQEDSLLLKDPAYFQLKTIAGKRPQLEENTELQLDQAAVFQHLIPSFTALDHSKLNLQGLLNQPMKHFADVPVQWLNTYKRLVSKSQQLLNKGGFLAQVHREANVALNWDQELGPHDKNIDWAIEPRDLDSYEDGPRARSYLPFPLNVAVLSTATSERGNTFSSLKELLRFEVYKNGLKCEISDCPLHNGKQEITELSLDDLNKRWRPHVREISLSRLLANHLVVGATSAVDIEGTVRAASLRTLSATLQRGSFQTTAEASLSIWNNFLVWCDVELLKLYCIPNMDRDDHVLAYARTISSFQMPQEYQPTRSGRIARKFAQSVLCLMHADSLTFDGTDTDPERPPTNLESVARSLQTLIIELRERNLFEQLSTAEQASLLRLATNIIDLS